MQTAGALEAAAVSRHLLEPSKEARDEAVAKTMEFIEKAAAVRTARRARGTQVTREEGLEAVRALETGATVLAAIHLRNADPQGALGALDKVRDVARPELVRALEAVIEKPESDKWLDLARMLRPPPRQTRNEEEDFGRDAELLRVASFAAATEAYRLDSASPEPAAFVAAMLVDLGMGEAAPAILADAVKAQKDPRIVGLALAITMQAMGRGARGRGARQRAPHVPRRRPDPRRGRRAQEGAAEPRARLRHDGRDRDPRRSPRRRAQAPHRVGRAREVRQRAPLARAPRLARRAGEERRRRASRRRSAPTTSRRIPRCAARCCSSRATSRARQATRAARESPSPTLSAISRRHAAPPRATTARASSGSSRVRSIASAQARAR